MKFSAGKLSAPSDKEKHKRGENCHPFRFPVQMLCVPDSQMRIMFQWKCAEPSDGVDNGCSNNSSSRNLFITRMWSHHRRYLCDSRDSFLLVMTVFERAHDIDIIRFRHFVLNTKQHRSLTLLAVYMKLDGIFHWNSNFRFNKTKEARTIWREIDSELSLGTWGQR